MPAYLTLRFPKNYIACYCYLTDGCCANGTARGIYTFFARFKWTWEVVIEVGRGDNIFLPN